VLLTFVEGTILSHSRKFMIMLDWLRASYSWFVLDDIEDVIDG